MKVARLQMTLRRVIRFCISFPPWGAFLAVTALLPGLRLATAAQQPERPASLAILDFGPSATGRLASQSLSANLKRETTVTVLDRDLAMAAAQGAGYAGSLNLSVSEARNLGAVLGCDFLILGDAQTLRRSPATDSFYFDSYASMFLVSARTGRLVGWERPTFQAATPAESEKSLLAELAGKDAQWRFVRSIRRAQEDERHERMLTTGQPVPIIEAAPDGDAKSAEAEGLRLPRPYRRFVPAYPESAALAEAEAVVDVLVDLDANGEVTRVEIARWAGFGLDEATITTVRQLHFFPAMRDGVAIPIRILLRYNFRRPAK
jgi:TonB family protein